VKIPNKSPEGFTYSSFQKDVIKHIASNKNSLIVEAVAGSAKTTTLLESLNYIPKEKSVCILAFNSIIKQELESKCSRHSTNIQTINAFGYGIWRNFAKRNLNVPYSKVNQWKTKNIIRKMEDDDNELFREIEGFHTEVAMIVSKLKLNEMVPSDVEPPKGLSIKPMSKWNSREIMKLIDHYGIFDRITIRVALRTKGRLSQKEIINNAEDLVPSLIRASKFVMKKSVLMFDEIDFDDQIFMPNIYDAPSGEYDILFLDESQDTSSNQLRLIEKAIGKKSKIVCFGDRRQAIYGFRGSSSTAMDDLKKYFNCDELPLSICYRCGKSIVTEAQEIVPHIMPFELSGDGKVLDSGDLDVNVLNEGDLVVSRYNAPLIEIALKLFSNQKKFQILGRGLHNDLINLILSFNSKTIQELMSDLNDWKKIKILGKKASNSNASTHDIEDQYNAIMSFISFKDYQKVSDIVKDIEEIFLGKSRGVHLSTIHQAKGREYESVYFIDRDKLPRETNNKEDHEQEMNLIYVAITRAKNNLNYSRSSMNDILPDRA